MLFPARVRGRFITSSCLNSDMMGQSLPKPNVRVTSVYPSISDMILRCRERRKGPILLKKSASNLRLVEQTFEGPRLRGANGLRLGEGLASVSASPAFGGFGRLLREGTRRAHRSVLVV
jgi:hypothetical protein